MGVRIIRVQPLGSGCRVETIISREKDQRGQMGGPEGLVRHESRSQLDHIVGAEGMPLQKITRQGHNAQVQLDKLVFGGTVGCKRLGRNVAIGGRDRPFPPATCQRAVNLEP